MRYQVLVFSAVTLLRVVAVADAGISTFTATKWTPSSGDRFCIIAAHVERIVVGDMGSDRPHILILRPRASLAGKLDPSLMPILEVRCYTGPNSAIEKLPDEGSMVLAAVGLRDPAEEGDFDRVVSAWCTFMPRQSSLVQINGLDDPLYVETLQKLQKERAQAVAGATTVPTTKP